MLVGRLSLTRPMLTGRWPISPWVGGSIAWPLSTALSGATLGCLRPRCGTRAHQSIVNSRFRPYVAPATSKAGLYATVHHGKRNAKKFLLRVLMAQHFLLSAAARSLSCAKIMRMSDCGVENVFLRLRWPETDGRPVCPRCSCTACHACRRSIGQPRWRLRQFSRQQSIVGGQCGPRIEVRPLRGSQGQ